MSQRYLMLAQEISGFTIWQHYTNKLERLAKHLVSQSIKPTLLQTKPKQNALAYSCR